VAATPLRPTTRNGGATPCPPSGSTSGCTAPTGSRNSRCRCSSRTTPWRTAEPCRAPPPRGRATPAVLQTVRGCLVRARSVLLTSPGGERCRWGCVLHTSAIQAYVVDRCLALRTEVPGSPRRRSPSSSNSGWCFPRGPRWCSTGRCGRSSRCARGCATSAWPGATARRCERTSARSCGCTTSWTSAEVTCSRRPRRT
jgi:hypothetical protein